MINLMNSRLINILFAFILLSIFIRYIKIFVGDIIYLVVLFPILIFMLLSFFSKKKLKLQSFDIVLIYCLVLLLINLFLSGIRGVLHSQAIFIVYVMIPFLFYFAIRKLPFYKDEFFKFLVVFALAFALATIAEFVVYVFFPTMKEIVTLYFKNVVQNNNFYAPYVNYPLLGYQTKPWGPMLDASGNGAFLSVLCCFVYERFNTLRTKYLLISCLILFLSVFLSGSKSAYIMVLAYFFIKNFVWFFIKPTLRVALVFILTPFVLGSALVLFVSFFFTPELLDFYFEAFVINPAVNFYDGIAHHGFATLFGLGQETSINVIVGTGEIDIVNSMFRYGFVFTVVMVIVLISLSILNFKSSPEFFALFFMSVVAMNHYQVSFKFPASLILFMSMAVFLNSRGLIKNNCVKV